MEKISFVIPCYRSMVTLPGVIKEIQDTMVQMDAMIWALFWCFQWFSARGFSHST